MTDQPPPPAPLVEVAPPQADAEPAAEPVLPADLDRVIEWLHTRTPSIAKARLAQACIDRIVHEVRDPALCYAWEHRREGATMKDLQAGTGISRGQLVWALGKHPRSDV